jgi:hypothetical protein
VRREPLMATAGEIAVAADTQRRANTTPQQRDELPTPLWIPAPARAPQSLGERPHLPLAPPPRPERKEDLRTATGRYRARRRPVARAR